jgi:homoserine O-acetyltransferase
MPEAEGVGSRTQHRYDPPDSPTSVGWTTPKRATLATPENPLKLETGVEIDDVTVEYEVYGELNDARDNAILIAHALSGDAHAAGWDAEAETLGRHWRTRKPGWWDTVIGPGKAIDTNTYCVICANVLGSCYGTTGPASLNPETGKPYGLEFPIVTVGDWVRMEARLLDELGVETLYAVVGGSLGGQQALEWALAFPERVRKCLILASSARLSAQGLAFNAVGRYAVLHDANFNGGQYYDGAPPNDGLAAARMLAHITYLSDSGMTAKFGRRLQDGKSRQSGFGVEFQVESYLTYQGESFVQRFDANSYLYITRAMDYYDAAARGDGDLAKACSRIRSEVMIVSFETDWLYPPDECRDLALALMHNNIPVNYVQVHSQYGHDAFLVETECVSRLLNAFLTRAPADSPIARCIRRGGCKRCNYKA